MQPSIKDLVINVLGQGYLMSLAVQDEGGLWVSDVNFVYDDDLNIYWMSDPEFRHSKAILNNSNVAGTITINAPKEDNFGIQFSGHAKKTDEEREDLISKYCNKKNRPNPEDNSKFLRGYSWYMLKPDRIELICEKYYGYDKKSIDLC